MQLLVDLNASTSAGAAVASGANTVFSGINTVGNVTNASLADVGLAYTPAQIRTAYGINSLSLDGTGQTIAIVDAYDDPAIAQALDTYDSQFGLTSSGPTLYQQYGPASSFLTVLNQNGQMSSAARDRPQRARQQQLGTRGSAGRGMGACHGARGPDHPRGSQQPVARPT